MPQGGIDENEDPYKAALRELYEETSIRSVEKLDEIEEWLTYDIPPRIAGDAWKGRYRGQKQKWYALRFTGNDGEINIATKHQEFSNWRWAPMSDLVRLVVPFKRDIYANVVEAFADLLWFPTGGGKTEAYLGLAAFTLVLRRLRKPTIESAGVTVLMRMRSRPSVRASPRVRPLTDDLASV